jgi:hypothetical protein
MNRARSLLLILAGALLLASPLFAADTKVGGEVHAYWNLHLNDQGTVVGDPGLVKNYSEFNITRAFLDMTHEFNDRFSARITADIYNTDDMNEWDFRAQYAYLQINRLLPYTHGRFGLQGLVWADRVEKAWGMRYVDPASLNKLGYINYADFGASLYGTCPGDWGELVLQVVNGGGYMENEENKYKDIAVFATITPLGKYPEFKETALWLQYYKGWPNIDPVKGFSFSDNTKKDVMSAAVLVKYKKWFTGYVDYFMATTDMKPTDVIDTTITGVELPEEEKALGFSAFGKLSVATDPETFLSDIFLFGKYEWVDKHDDHTAPGLELYADADDAKYITLGAAYTLADGFEFALTFRRSTVNRIEVDEEQMPLRIAETEKNSLLVNMKADF